jgi:hypothetical protein
MANNAVIPVSSVVAVTVAGTPVNLQVLNINTCALISTETPLWASSLDYQVYQGATQVGVDFGTNSKAFAIATAFFAQNPNPIGTQGYLVIVPCKTGVPATLVVQDLTYTAKATGTGGNSISITYAAGGIAGQETVAVSGSAITVTLASGSSTAQQVLNAINSSQAALNLITAYLSGTGTNAQTSASVTSLSGGSASGTEPYLNAIIRTQNEIYYFGIMIDSDLNGSTATLNALCGYIQTQDKMFFYAESESAAVSTGGALANIVAAGYTNTRPLYYHDGVTNDTLVMAAAYASVLLSTNFLAPNSTKTMNLKTLTGVTPDQTVTPTLLQTAQANGIDVYPAVGNPLNGVLLTSGINQFADQVYNQFWFKFQLQTSIFNFLAQTQSKIPQTELGMTALKNVCLAVCQQAVTNGFVAAGAWTSAVPFGNPQDFVRCIGDVGYYVYSQPVALQSPTARAARQAPPVSIALKMAGAIHTVTVNVQINL